MLVLLVLFIVGTTVTLSWGAQKIPSGLAHVLQAMALAFVWSVVAAALASARERFVWIAGRVRNVPVSDEAVVARWRPRSFDWCMPLAVVLPIAIGNHWY
jgi:hypothetical protein